MSRYLVLWRGRLGEFETIRENEETVTGRFSPDVWRVLIPNEGVEVLTLKHEDLRRIANEAGGEGR